MRFSFVFPSSGIRTGGVIVLYEFANGLARRGHQVNFFHGPTWPTRVDRIDQLPDLCFGHGVDHFIVDSFDDPELPEADVMFHSSLPSRLGLPAVFVQGHRMFGGDTERTTFRELMPKLCVASWLTEIGAGYGVPAEQLMYVPPGIDHEVFIDLGKERTIDVAVLYHPHTEKGWDVASTALAALRERNPDLRLVVFGRDELDPVPSGIEFLHGLEHEELIPRMYSRTRVFLQTSYNEGFGLTPVEAMACGCALVTTDCGGSRDYALDGDTALVVPPGEPDRVVEAVESLLSDDQLRTRLASRGEKHVRRFDWDSSAALLEQYMADYVADPARFQQHPSADD